MDHPLVAKGLTKQFGDFTAVDGIDFVVEPGQTFGVLGPNGAGKSSTMKMVSTVSPRTGGDLRVFGLDPDRDGREIRSRLGVVPQEDILDVDLTARENLMIYQRYFGVPWKQTRTKADQLLEFMQLGDRGDSKVEPLSGGMKRRLTIARALVNDPEMILLDEPTTGLDPQARHLLWERLYRLKEQGVTLLLTTHYMDEAEQLADRLVIMDHGKILAEGKLDELMALHGEGQIVTLRGKFAEDDARTCLAGFDVNLISAEDGCIVVSAPGDGAVKLLAQLDDRLAVDGVSIQSPSLNGLFLRLTGRELRD